MKLECEHLDEEDLEVAPELARSIMDHGGADPEYLSIVEEVDEYFEEFEDEVDIEDRKAEMVTLLDLLISSAVTTIAFPPVEDLIKKD